MRNFADEQADKKLQYFYLDSSHEDQNSDYFRRYKSERIDL